MAKIKFNFENQSPTFVPPSRRSKALEQFSTTKSELGITIRRERGSFDILSNVRQQRKNPSFGQRSLAAFNRQNDATPFTVKFSKNVYSVSVEMGDYGEDNDELSLQALDGNGQIITSDTDRLPPNGKSFTSNVLTVKSVTPIRSIKMIGGSPGGRNSVFYDNLVVDTNPSSGSLGNHTPATARDLGSLSGTFNVRGNYNNRSGNDDYYKFTLDQIGQLSYSTTSPVFANIFFDADNDGILTNREILSKGMLGALLPGTYYIMVGAASNTVAQYDLNLSITLKPGNLPSDPGDAKATSLDITNFLSSGSFTAIDYVGQFDEIDYLKFTINQRRIFKASITGGAFTNMFLQPNSDGTVSPGDGVYFAEFPPAPKILQPGTYFIRVGDGGEYATNRYELALNLS